MREKDAGVKEDEAVLATTPPTLTKASQNTVWKPHVCLNCMQGWYRPVNSLWLLLCGT